MTSQNRDEWDSSKTNPVNDLRTLIDTYPRQLQMNDTHRFGEHLGDIPEADIAALSRMRIEGSYVGDVLTSNIIPFSIRAAIAKLPWGWGGERKHQWLYVRAQHVVLGQPDRRSGSFWHIDVDAVYRSVAPDWDDFRAMAVSFGNVAETEFIKTPFSITVDGPPRSSHYVELLPQLADKAYTTHSPAPGQIAHYTVRDFHRAGPPRKSGWRLIVLAFETNAPPQDKWP